VNKFNEIKNSVDIVQACQMYGVKLDRYNKGCCPFHTEKTPSFSVSQQKQLFKCFGCGKSGSVLDLVSTLFGLNILDSAKKINDDFHLRLDFEKPTQTAVNKHKQAQNEVEFFKQWEKETFDLLCDEFKHGTECKDKIEYYLDMFISGELDDKIWFYKNCKSVVKKLVNRQRKNN
jgi:DNA primase